MNFLKKYKKILILLLIIVAFIILKNSGLQEYLTFENLQNNKEDLNKYVSDKYVLSVVIFIGIYIVSVAFSLPGATILSLSGGFLFGAVFGTIYINIAASSGAILAFLVARFLLGESIQKKYSEKLNKFNNELDKNGYSYLLTLRLIPIFPFFLINFFAGLTKLSLFTFAWTTSLGIIPGSFVYAYAGKQLGEINAVEDIFTKEILFAFLLLAALALVPTIYKKFIKKKT